MMKGGKKEFSDNIVVEDKKPKKVKKEATEARKGEEKHT